MHSQPKMLKLIRNISDFVPKIEKFDTLKASEEQHYWKTYGIFNIFGNPPKKNDHEVEKSQCGDHLGTTWEAFGDHAGRLWGPLEAMLGVLGPT